MGSYDENICMCTLNRIFGDKPKISRALVEKIGSAEEVFRTGGERLREVVPYCAEIAGICDREYEKSEDEMESLINAVVQKILAEKGSSMNLSSVGNNQGILLYETLSVTLL